MLRSKYMFLSYLEQENDPNLGPQCSAHIHTPHLALILDVII